MSYSSVRPDTQKHSQAKKLKAEVHSGDVVYAAFIGYCFIQSRVYWLFATKIKRLSPAYILTYILLRYEAASAGRRGSQKYYALLPHYGQKLNYS